MLNWKVRYENYVKTKKNYSLEFKSKVVELSFTKANGKQICEKLDIHLSTELLAKKV
jgi:transposase-like protein